MWPGKIEKERERERLGSCILWNKMCFRFCRSQRKSQKVEDLWLGFCLCLTICLYAKIEHSTLFLSCWNWWLLKHAEKEQHFFGEILNVCSSEQCRMENEWDVMELNFRTRWRMPWFWAAEKAVVIVGQWSLPYFLLRWFFNLCFCSICPNLNHQHFIWPNHRSIH